MLKIANNMLDNLFNNKIAYQFSFNYPCPRKLREVVKLSMIEKQPTHQVKQIWKQYHEHRPANISASLEKEEYFHLLQRLKKAPMFLLPIHRKGGHFKILTQWQDNCFLCTSLEDFKRYGAKAHPYIVFTLFTQLLFLKGIVLARGDIVNNMITKLQAQKLWHLLNSSYKEQQKFQLVDNFNNNAGLFDEKKFNSIYRIQ